MPVRPQLMVLYTNDAVEVRYSDGSRLHILPCGTAFTYHTTQEAHPVHGLKSVQQRCQYVTSMYRGLVSPAMDFRNRFAERPFVCRELLEQEQVIDLYAKISQVGWPKQASNQNCAVLDTGSVKITSEDEFGSLILSPHRKDFTICYLSALSREKRRERKSKNKSTLGGSQNVSHNNNSDRNLVTHRHGFAPKATHISQNNRSVTPENVDHFGFSRSGKMDGKMGDELNISPITQASCADSPPAMSTASGSPITPLDALKDGDAKFRPFSTPTQELDNQEPTCTPYGSTAVFHKYTNNRIDQANKNGSYLEEQPVDAVSRSKETICRFEQEQPFVNPQSRLERQVPPLLKSHGRSERHDTSGSSEGSSASGRSCDDGAGTESETKCSYCWVTRHMSCEECPVAWSHVLKMAQAVAEGRCAIQDTGQENKTRNQQSLKDSAHLRPIKRDQCVFSALPRPLPLTCPGQHLHKAQVRKVYSDDRDPMEDPSTLAQGHLKVLLVDGVIYRIVRHPTMKMVEIYPGDGSVLVSQGMSAHFFLHVLPQGDKIEERTYSVKTPPQKSPGDYSIRSLVSRACRFLAYARQEDSTSPASAGLCCWKHEEMPLQEPMSTTVLEECTIPGHGKFTALSNGQVRIAFADRTCLDMTCDFSARIHNCMEHSGGGSNVQVPVPDKKAGTCRLLLPNGQYQMVDVKQPGVYKRYIDMADEWAGWVNSSPAQRSTFYRNKNQEKNMHMSVERELQRIQCFNYLVDNVVLKKGEAGSSLNDPGPSGAFRPYSNQEPKPGPSILRNANNNNNKPLDDYDHGAPIRSVQINSPPRSLMGSSTNQISHNISSMSSQSARSSVIGHGQPWNVAHPIRPSFTGGQRPMMMKDNNALEGFDAVRQALLRTSNAIKDIDQMLGKN